MEGRCTIFCEERVHQRVIEFLRSPSVPYELEGPADAWDKLIAWNGLVTFHARVESKPGDAFSNAVLGTYSHLARLGRRRLSDLPTCEQEALKQLSRSTMSLGVVMTDWEQQEGDVFRLVAHLGALVFNGTQLMDGTGEVLVERTDS